MREELLAASATVTTAAAAAAAVKYRQLLLRGTAILSVTSMQAMNYHHDYCYYDKPAYLVIVGA